MTNRSIEFFERQFRRQIGVQEFVLNPFERRALEVVRGSILDFGCGLGNFALEAARRGHDVTAVDASPSAIECIRATAKREKLPVQAIAADVTEHPVEGTYDTVLSIGLLMFVSEERALDLLAQLQRAVHSGGLIVINVLVQGTTYLEMFDPRSYCLFETDALVRRFDGWELVSFQTDSFPAPGDTHKVFATIIARKQRDPCASDACSS